MFHTWFVSAVWPPQLAWKNAPIKLNAESTTIKSFVCLTAFNKKPFFKGGTIEIDSIRGLCKVPYLLEKGSTLNIGNELIKYNSKDVESIMYGNQYGKATEK